MFLEDTMGGGMVQIAMGICGFANNIAYSPTVRDGDREVREAREEL